MKTSIIIPFYTRWDLTHQLLYQLWGHSLQKHPETEIVLVDDCSPGKGEYEGGIKWWQDGPMVGRFRYYQHKENKGFGQTCNTGAKIAMKHGSDVVAFVSTDVTVMGDLVKDIETLINLDKNIVIGGTILCNDTGWNVLPNCGPVPYAEGWMVACHVDVWKELGGFDLGYGKFDYEDIDLSTSAWMKGYKLVPVATKLKHASGKTISTVTNNRIATTYKNRDYWQQKWASKASELKAKIYGGQTSNSVVGQ